MRQWPGRAVDQEQLELGTDSGWADPEAGPFEQLPERGQAFFEPFGEAGVVALVEFFLVYVGSDGRTSPSWAAAAPGCGLPRRCGEPLAAEIRRPVSAAGRMRT
jgi:hypothetical protein